MDSANVTAAELLANLSGGGRIFDESAQTVREIAASLGVTERTARDHVLKNRHLLEKVWKHGPVRPVPAYRPKQK